MNGPQIVPVGCPCGCGHTVAWSARCCSFVGIHQEDRADAEIDLTGHLAHAHRMRMPQTTDTEPAPEPAEQPDLFAAPSPVEQEQ